MAFIELNNYTKALKMYRADYGEDPDDIDELVDYLGSVYVHGARASDAQSTIPEKDLESINLKDNIERIVNSSDVHNEETRVSKPDSFNFSRISLERYELYTLWRFDFTKFQEAVVTFEAYSLMPFIDGADHVISYDTRTGEFSGYGNDRVDQHTYVLLFEEPIEPTLRLPVSEGSIAPEQWHGLNTIRQVNWAANQLECLGWAVRMYLQDFGEYPRHMDTLLTLEYLVLDRPVQIWWDFGLDSLTVYSVSTNNMAGSRCDTLFYDIWSEFYYGAWAKWKSPFVGL
jgi:hypothetical protein